MSEVKGNSNSGDSTGLLHPVATSVSNSHTAKNIEKPLETNAQALHLLSQKQSVAVSSQPIAIESSNMQFNSATGSKNSQKVDLFAEQNAKLAEKKQKHKKSKRIAIIISSAVGGLAIIGILVVVLLNVLKTADGENEIITTITDYNTVQNESQQKFDETDKTASEITSYYAELINNSTSNEEKATLHIGEISSLAQNGFTDEAIQAASNFESSSYEQNSNQAQLSIYYGVMINVYSSLNDTEKVKYYLNLLQQTEFKPDAEVIG